MGAVEANAPRMSRIDPSAPLHEQTYALLKSMIDDGRIVPGERLLEAQIVKAFGISRSPARRALQALHSEKIILDHGKGGYTVAGAPAPMANRLAALGAVRISQPRRWECMYSDVEQELYSKVLFGSVRINDQRLAKHFGVSRTVTRDLLARMHGVGLIAKDDTGHWIAERVTPERIRHLYEMRHLLEPAALLQAAPRLPRKLLQRARANILSALSTAPIDSAKFDQAETDLHLEILGFSSNTEIMHALRRTHLLFGPTRHLIDPILGIPMAMIETALQEHLEIIDLLEADNAKSAAAALAKHLTDAIQRWLGRFEIAARVEKIEFPPYLAPL